MPGNNDAKQIARCAVLACLLEATARKPGNVHPTASFRDLTYADFVRSAHSIGPSFEHAGEWSVGRIVLDEKPIPDVGPTDALVRITTTTICGTDVLIVPDMTQDRRFDRSAMVVGNLHCRFYCGRDRSGAKSDPGRAG